MHKKITWLRKTFGQYWKSRDLSFIPNHCFHWLIQLKSHFLRTYWILLFEFGSSVVATRSRKQTHSEEQCRWWSAVYYTGGPKAEFPLSQGPWPTFVKILYTLSVLLKSTSPNSLNLAWKVLKGDTIGLQPWFIIRRVSWLYTVLSRFSRVQLCVTP